LSFEVVDKTAGTAQAVGSERQGREAEDASALEDLPEDWDSRPWMLTPDQLTPEQLADIKLCEENAAPSDVPQVTLPEKWTAETAKEFELSVAVKGMDKERLRTVQQETWYPTKEDLAIASKKWFLVDAANLRLGRMASEIAKILLGKNKVEFTQGATVGDHVIVINAEKVVVIGKKFEKKLYRRHSGRPGGMKIETFKELQQRIPERIIYKAVWGMLPKNSHGRELFRHLKVYAGDEHPHAAQQPEQVYFGGRTAKRDERKISLLFEEPTDENYPDPDAVKADILKKYENPDGTAIILGDDEEDDDETVTVTYGNAEKTVVRMRIPNPPAHLIATSAKRAGVKMAMPSIDDAKSLTNEEIESEIRNCQKELFFLRTAVRTRQEHKPHVFKHTKHRISQLQFLLGQREREAEE